MFSNRNKGRDKAVFQPISLRILFILITCGGDAQTAKLIQAPKCPHGMFVLVEDGNKMRCVTCIQCPAEYGTSIPCGSISYRTKTAIECVPCVNGTSFSNTYGTSTCERCTVCREGRRVEKHCSHGSDTVCGKCKRGYYFSVITFGCIPCTHCCGDEQDHIVDECIKQGLPKSKSCSIHNSVRCYLRPKSTTKSNVTKSTVPTDTPVSAKPPIYQSHNTTRITIIHKTEYINSPEHENRFQLLLLTTVATFVLIIFSVLCFYFIRFSPKQKFLQMRLRVKKHPLTSDVSSQVNDLSDWSKKDPNTDSYKFNSGITVNYDKNSEENSEKVLAVEEVRDSDMSVMVNHKTNQAFLSPISQFYLAKGETFEKPVTVTLPHSALVDSSNAWDIQVLCADLRKGEKVKWMGVEGDVEVEANEVSFSTHTLLAYVVVGNPKAPGVQTKKRMQLAVFACSEMDDNEIKAILYLFDDNETPFQRIQQEEKRSGRAMLGTLYAAFIDCFNDKSIAVKINGISAGWQLKELVPESIRTEQCANSYFDVPKWEATFRRVGPCDIKFQCTFAVDAAGKQINVPAITCFPEVLPSVYVGPVDVVGKAFPGETSLHRDLAFSLKRELYQTIDIPYRGVGSWRKLGKLLGIPEDEVEVCSKQYAHVDGSPTTVLFEMLEARMPHLTVGELVDVLKQMGRFDVVNLMMENMKEQRPMVIINDRFNPKSKNCL